MTDKGFRLIQTGNIGVGIYIEKEAKKYIYKNSFEKLKCKELIVGDVLICRLAEPAGRACILPELGEEKVITSVDVTIFRPNLDNFNRCYLVQFFSTPKWFELVTEQVGGTTHKRIARGALGKIPVAIPSSVEEQRLIAEALSDADALIESLDQLIAKKRQIKQGAMQELLTGKRRLPGFSGEWEAKRLGDVAHLYQPTTISAHQFTAAGYPVYGANGVVGYFDNFNHSTWQVTVTCRGSTCGTVNRTVNKCWITGNAMVIGCDGNASISKEFLYYALSFCDLSTCITGTGQPQIVRAPLANFEIRVPIEVFEQSAIATILSDMDSELAALESRLAKARQIKQGMMQELLTGRVRLT
ncbi:restriction endonuclease subunit S [Acidovorax temperans]|uniref:restriction endonuclease subunit S n=1 Tax=Acidovorax temperans TaxID=80878 RepID=UPI003204F9C6